MIFIDGKNYVFLIVVLIVFAAATGHANGSNVHDNMVKLYRTFRVLEKDHMITMSFNEYFLGNIEDKGKRIDLDYLGLTAATKMCDCLTPLYRYYSLKLQDHFYTAGKAEIATIAKQQEYVLEGATGYVAENADCCNATLHVHRFFSPSLKDHHFATDTEEIYDFLRSDSGYNDEGVPFYIWPKPSACSCVADSGGGDASIQ